MNLHRALYFPGKNDIFYPEGRRLVRALGEAERALPPAFGGAPKTQLRPESAAFIENEFDPQRAALKDRYGIDFVRSAPPGTEAARPKGAEGGRCTVDELFEISPDRLTALTAAMLHRAVRGE